MINKSLNPQFQLYEYSRVNNGGLHRKIMARLGGGTITCYDATQDP